LSSKAHLRSRASIYILPKVTIHHLIMKKIPFLRRRRRRRRKRRRR
jgi:hypothetical protein